jgi:RimJ/RimL family protein N-acetyltransferase
MQGTGHADVRLYFKCPVTQQMRCPVNAYNWREFMEPSNPNSSVSSIIPTIETDRLRLREWRLSDLDAYSAFKTNSALQQYIIGGAKPKEAVWDDYCSISGQWALRGIGLFLVADKNSDNPVGLTGFWYPLDLEAPELCWSLFPGNTGSGYATEAALAARQWVFQNLSYPHLVSYIHPDNTASCRVAKRLGAKLDCKTTLYGEPRLLFVHPGPATPA